jgi:hypothetical protein
MPPIIRLQKTMEDFPHLNCVNVKPLQQWGVLCGIVLDYELHLSEAQPPALNFDTARNQRTGTDNI